jgi:hypothetical protein
MMLRSYSPSIDSKIYFLCVFLLFLWAKAESSAQVALANFGPDQKPVGIFIKPSTGEALKLGDFPAGQATGFLNLEPRQTEFVFEHPTLGKKSISVHPSNSPTCILYSTIKIMPPEKGKPAEPVLAPQKLLLGQPRAKGYRGINLCTNSIVFSVDGKKVQCNPGTNESGFIELSSSQRATIAREDGSDPITYSPLEASPFVVFFYPTGDNKSFGWTAQPEPAIAK